MSEPKKRRLTAGRIMAALPVTVVELRALLSDVPKNTLGTCLRSLLFRGVIAKQDSGLLVATGTKIERNYIRKTRTAPMEDPKSETAPAKTTLWNERPEMSPQVTCPARGMVGYSTCLDGYTAAESGHRSGPAECRKCSVGRYRREVVARGAL